MDVNAYKATLDRAGYREIATRTKEPLSAVGDHAHEYTARGLVTAGEFVITCDGASRSYKAGDEFEVAAGRVHSESAGPEGACITVGRKY